MSTSSSRRGAKADVVVMSPLVIALRMDNAQHGANLVRSDYTSRSIGLHLVNAELSPFRGDDVPATLSATRGQDHFIEQAGPFVGSRQDFFPLETVDLVNHLRVGKYQ
jgi:hypothetical protein